MSKENRMEKGCILGKTGRFMMENGKMDLNMGMGCGKDLKMSHTLENGVKVRRTDMECIHGNQEIGMKENGRNV